MFWDPKLGMQVFKIALFFFSKDVYHILSDMQLSFPPFVIRILVSKSDFPFEFSIFFSSRFFEMSYARVLEVSRLNMVLILYDIRLLLDVMFANPFFLVGFLKPAIH